MATSQAHFPDLTPPHGWKAVSLPPQLRLVPPGTTLDTSKATIIISPIAARRSPMPPPDQLIQQAIEFEIRNGLQVVSRGEPEPALSDHGLAGFAVHVTARDTTGASDQRRIYVIYLDEQFLYGLNFLAFGDAYDTFVETFRQVARSVRPFAGRVVPVPPIPPVVD